MENPSIEKYLLSTCLFTIDEFNEKYDSLSKDELKKIADNNYNEMDICVKIGYPFSNVHYTVGDDKDDNKNKSNHDLYIKSKNFKIEIKYLKNYKSGYNSKSNSKIWKPYQKDFDWLEAEIKNGNKGRSAFIIGWFNCVERFSQLMQLGATRGSKPLVNEHKLVYFPFLQRLALPTHTQDLTYDYEESYTSKKIKFIGVDQPNIDCLFLGNKNDKFHFVIYY